MVTEQNSYASIAPNELDRKLSELNQQKNNIERSLKEHVGSDSA